MTLRGGRGWTNYYSKILLQLWHFIAELTLYQMLESGKDTSLHRTDDRVSHNEQLIDTVSVKVH